MAALAFASWGSDAHAQAQTNSTTTITIGQKVGRRLPDADVGSEYIYRNARRWWINYDECVADEWFDFYVTLTNPGNRFEVWAGNEDCAANRSRDDKGQCWILASNDRPMDNFTISFPVRNVVAHLQDIVDPPMELGPEVCDQDNDSDGLQVKFYFFIQDGGEVQGTGQTWDPTNLGGVGFDMVGPEPPESITIGMGESQLSVNVEGVVEEPDRERFAAFCAPGTVDATFIPAEGVTVPCTTTELMPGSRPNPALKCGEASETSQTITTDPDLPGGDLENETLYAVGVSGEDVIGNAGPLSPLACGMPKELDDFFELYGGANGPGGGGFCSVSPGVSHSAPGATALLGALLAVFGLRRGRSRA